ncbi:MAG: NAD-dependent epimerase/dehydratase family protein [Rhodospirillaceae bacterium]
MTTLITGANGFTGSHVVRALCQRDRTVRGLVRTNSDLGRLNGLDVELVTGDLTDAAALKAALAGVETVIHTAARVDLGIVDATEMIRTNVEGTRTLLDGAVAAGVRRFVHCSTIGIYGHTGAAIADETHRRDPTTKVASAYDRSKLDAQALVDHYGATHDGFEVISVMPSGILGQGDPHFGPVVTRFLAGRLKYWVASHRITGIVHVEDVAEALVLAAERGKAGVHYIASAGELTTGEMFAILAANAGLPEPKELPEPLVRLLGHVMDPVGRLLNVNPPLSRERVHYLYDRCVRVDAAKARKELGWQPQTPEETVRRLIP